MILNSKTLQQSQAYSPLWPPRPRPGVLPRGNSIITWAHVLLEILLYFCTDPST